MKISAFTSPRKSMIARSAKPRSIFQSITRIEFCGQSIQPVGAKFPTSISLSDFTFMLQLLSSKTVAAIRITAKLGLLQFFSAYDDEGCYIECTPAAELEPQLVFSRLPQPHMQHGVGSNES